MKIKISILLALLGLFSLFIVNTLAAPLADPDDIFFVDKPRPSSRLSETSTLTFKIYDDDFPNPPYEIALYQPNCTTKFGTIVSNEYAIKNESNIYTKEWNTDGPIKDRSTIPNGDYCLKACVTLKKDGSNYSVCDSRPITLIDPAVNKSPTITSSPPNTVLLVGQRFGYDVEATDPDGDKLTYSLVNPPNFLQINSSTGEISSKDIIANAGSFSVVVKVTDGQGGEDIQKFNITVEEKPTEEVKKIEFILPAEGDIFIGESNPIKFELENIDNIEKITLFYSADAENWTQIQELGGDTREYNWDVTDLEEGDYYLKLEILTKDKKKYQSISSLFSVKSEEVDYESSVSIINLNPGEDAQVKEVTELRATLVPSENAQIDEATLVVRLDEENITELCSVQEEQVVCDLSEKTLDEGRHKASIEFSDTAGKQTLKEWYFEIKTEDQVEPAPVEEKGLSTVALVGIICAVTLVLLLVPWILYLFWKRKKLEEERALAERRENQELEVATDTDSLTTYYYPDKDSSDSMSDSEDDMFHEDDLNIGEATLGGSNLIEQPAQQESPRLEEPQAEEQQEVNSEDVVQVEEPVKLEEENSEIEEKAEDDQLQEAQPVIEQQETAPEVQQSTIDTSSPLPSQIEETPSANSIEDVKESEVKEEQTTETVSPSEPLNTSSEQIEVQQADKVSETENSVQSEDDAVTEADIPDWLKTDAGGSTPFAPAGNPIELPEEEKQDDLSGANPYGDYGLAKKDDQDN